jgi:hypothetical protein|tara:strand:- start:1046 stop:1402 length:357 start_codon:yes stop_codon:yes gene_type:complete
MFVIDRDADVALLVEKKKKRQHKCITGRVVNFYSERTRSDLEKRIDDAIHSRNDESHRTDARSYYNGVLRVLRRKLRDVNRELAKKELTETSSVDQMIPKPSRRGTSGQRILKLSGIL